MKKCLLVYALAITVASANPVCAKTARSGQPLKNLPNFEEIILNKDSPYVETEKVSVAGEALPLVAEDAQALSTETTSPAESSLENTNGNAQKSNKGFFSIFNLKGGVEKAEPVGETSTNAETEKTVVKQWMDGDYATGRWFGARPLLESHGLTINSSLLYSPAVKTDGGASGNTNAKGYSLYNLGITLDTEKAGMWKGGTFYALYQKKTGYGISGANSNNGAMGDWMGLDGWDWRQINQMSEYWYQQKLFNNKLRLKFGKQDANTDFGFLNSGWDFINTAFSINPATPLPTYPDQSFGFVAEISPKEWISIRNGIYSRFNVPFNITEIELKPKIKKMPGRYLLGAWELSDSTGMGVGQGMNPDGSTYCNNFNRNYGAYAAFEQMVYKENKKDENDMQGLVVFGQFGVAPADKNDMNRYVGGGLHYVGPIPKRNKDIAGIAVASGNFASRLADVGSDYISRVGSETVIEAFYRIQINKWFYFQPDVQFIMNPGGCYQNSVAIGLRTAITF